MDKPDVDILVHIFLWIYVSFALGKYLGVELLGHTVSLRNCKNFFQSGWTHLSDVCVCILILDIQVGMCVYIVLLFFST